MDLQKSANLFIYRIREKGLEIFLKNDGEQWELPQHPVAKEKAVALEADDRLIALDPVEADGSLEDGIAMEGDWHDIPSLKSLLIQDVKFMKNEVKQVTTDAIEKGTFIAVKDAFKRVLPHQYEMLKELKDIITDRNSVKGI